MSWREMTNEQALAVWDANESVWSCEMGGMGPGYEQCIQILGFEMLRAMLADPFDWEAPEGEDRKKQWAEYVSKIKRDPRVSVVIDALGPSGAQGSAALNIAGIFARQGYAAGMEMVPEDRRIQVRKKFPVLT